MAKEKWMEYDKIYERRDDDSTNCILIIEKIPTGGVQLRIHDWDTGEQMIVCFRDTGAAGGRSPNIFNVLQHLALAIEQDNEEHPLSRWEKEVNIKQLEKNRLVLNRLRAKRKKQNGGH